MSTSRAITFVMISACLLGSSAAQGSLIMLGVNDDTDVLWSYDLNAGTCSPIGRIAEGGSRVDEIESLAFDLTTGRLYGVQDGLGNAESSLFEIDPLTAIATRIGPVGFKHVESLSFNPLDGLLYGTANNGNTTELLTVDLPTGAGSLVATFKKNTKIEGLTWSPDGTQLLGTSNASSSKGKLVELDPSSGKTFVIGTDIGHKNVEALEFGPDGVLYAASDTSNVLLTIDPATGVGTELSVFGCQSDIEGITFIPEPTTLLLMVVGLSLAILPAGKPGRV